MKLKNKFISKIRIHETIKSLIKFLSNLRHLRNWFIITAIIAVIYLFFYGFYTIPIIDMGFFKMQEPVFRDYLFIASASLLSGLIFTIFIESRKKVDNAGKGILAGGFLGVAFGTLCPACLGLNFLILGNVFALPLPFLIKYIGIIQGLSIIILLIGLWYISKSLLCNECRVDSFNKHNNNFYSEPRQNKINLDFRNLSNQSLLIIIMLVLASGLFLFQLNSALALNGKAFYSSSNIGSSGSVNINRITNDVLPPEGITTEAEWGDIVAKMVDEGILKPDELKKILKNRYGQEVKPEWEAILSGENAKISIDGDSSVFMMYLLWTFAKHNDVSIIHESNFASAFKNYDIGVGRSGYGDVKILELTPEQIKIARNVAQNSYRPCCGQSAANPDCSHGYSALGLIEIMAAQGFSEDEIFDAFVSFNSYWFPSTYIQNAIYFELTEGKRWNDVDKKLIAGKEFSSLQGSYSVKQYLKEQGI